MQLIEIDKIIVKERKRKCGDVSKLAGSIGQVGLINPVTVNKDLVLVAGLHRLEACRQLGWSEIPAIILDADVLKAELAEIDENLIRNPLSALEQADQMKRRKEIYEALHPESAPENVKKANLKNVSSKRNDFASTETAKSFTQDAAEKTGKSQRSIQQGVKIGRDIPEEIKQKIKGTELENSKTDLMELAKVKEPEKQRELVEKVKTGKAKSIKAAIQEESTSPQKPEEEVHISVEEYKKVKSQLDLSKMENEQLKAKVQKLEAEVQELKKQLPQPKKEEIKNDVTTENSEKIDYENGKILVDDEWLELPPGYDMAGKTHEQMFWIANNYNVNKQKELANASSKI